MRRNVVGAQIATFGAVVLNGVVHALRAISGNVTAEVALLRFALMGPLTLLAVLGSDWIAWYFQQTAMQNLMIAVGVKTAKELGQHV